MRRSVCSFLEPAKQKILAPLRLCVTPLAKTRRAHQSNPSTPRQTDMKLKRLLKWTVCGVLVVFFAITVWGVITYWTTTNECDKEASALVHPMKAVRFCEYGVVTLAEVEKPVPNDNQVLIKIRAASLNSLDAYLVRDMWLVRLFFGLRKPRDTITRLGRDLAGEVEAVGKNVTRFKPGDEVFGSASGALAEYVCSSGRALVMKPANVTFDPTRRTNCAARSARGKDSRWTKSLDQWRDRRCRDVCRANRQVFRRGCNRGLQHAKYRARPVYRRRSRD